jgi:hypothetical protein
VYTLILTWLVVTGSYSSGAVAIHSVPGFATEADCLAAGNSWLQGKKQYAQALCAKAK